VSQKIHLPRRVLEFIFQRLTIFKGYFTRIFCVEIPTKLRFVQLSINSTKLRRTMRRHPEHLKLHFTKHSLQTFSVWQQTKGYYSFGNS